jgi:hypothetical protein
MRPRCVSPLDAAGDVNFEGLPEKKTDTMISSMAQNPI